MSKQTQNQTHTEANKKPNPLIQAEPMQETAVPVNLLALQRAYTEPNSISPTQAN